MRSIIGVWGDGLEGSVELILGSSFQIGDEEEGGVRGIRREMRGYGA